MIRWTMQIMVWAADIAILAACVFLSIYAYKYHHPFVFITALIAVGFTVLTWKDSGGFMAWTQYREWLKHAKKLGL